MITIEQFTELAHRTASRYSHRSEPARAFYTFSPEALADFHRQVCAAVEADRAQRVPDVEAHDELMALAERIEEARGRSICVMPEFAKVLRTLLASTPAPAQQEPSEAEMVCAEAYQVVGCLLSDLGIFETEAARKILDNLSEARRVHQDVLPWESAAQRQEQPQQERKPMTPAASDVLAERQRQISVEGWTPEHDDEHTHGELVQAAADLCLYGTDFRVVDPDGDQMIGWGLTERHRDNRRRQLVIAGALIIADIERRDRAERHHGIKE